MGKKKDAMTSLRIESGLLQELDAEVPLVQSEPQYQALRITRGVLINMAVREWLDSRKKKMTPK
jgi:hypothetical protein